MLFTNSMYKCKGCSGDYCETIVADTLTACKNNARDASQGYKVGPKVGQIGPKWDKSGNF